MIQCSKCQMQYVGQTSRTLRERASGHKYMAKTNNSNILYKHYNQPGHNMIFVGLEKLSTEDLIHRHNQEAHWILQLDTITPHGLNTRDETLYIGNRSKQRIPFVHTFHPTTNTKLSNILSSIWNTFANNNRHPEFTEYFPGPPLVAYRKNKSLKDILTHTQFTYT